MTLNKLEVLQEALHKVEWVGVPPLERQAALQRYYFTIDRKKGELEKLIKAKETELDILMAEAEGYDRQGMEIYNNIIVCDRDFDGGIYLNF